MELKSPIVSLGEVLRIVHDYIVRNRLPAPPTILSEYEAMKAFLTAPEGLAELVYMVGSGYYDESNPLHLYILFSIKEYPRLCQAILTRSSVSLEDFPYLQKFSQLVGQGLRGVSSSPQQALNNPSANGEEG